MKQINLKVRKKQGKNNISRLVITRHVLTPTFVSKFYKNIYKNHIHEFWKGRGK